MVLSLFVQRELNNPPMLRAVAVTIPCYVASSLR